MATHRARQVIFFNADGLKFQLEIQPSERITLEIFKTSPIREYYFSINPLERLIWPATGKGRAYVLSDNDLVKIRNHMLALKHSL